MCIEHSLTIALDVYPDAYHSQERRQERQARICNILLTYVMATALCIFQPAAAGGVTSDAVLTWGPPSTQGA